MSILNRFLERAPIIFVIFFLFFKVEIFNFIVEGHALAKESMALLFNLCVRNIPLMCMSKQ